MVFKEWATLKQYFSGKSRKSPQRLISLLRKAGLCKDGKESFVTKFDPIVRMRKTTCNPERCQKTNSLDLIIVFDSRELLT
jgi:hypothetical protein